MDLDLNSVFNQKLPLSNTIKVYGLGLEQCLQPKTATVKPWCSLQTWAGNSVSNQKLPLSTNPGTVYRLGLQQFL